MLILDSWKLIELQSYVCGAYTLLYVLEVLRMQLSTVPSIRCLSLFFFDGVSIFFGLGMKSLFDA